MQIPKDQILSMIESQQGGDAAQQAADQLPDQVDHEEHGGMLSQFGINPQELAGQFGGGQGGGQGGSQFGGGQGAADESGMGRQEGASGSFGEESSTQDDSSY